MPKILIVDDEKHIRMLLEQTLEEFADSGTQLYFADNGEDALALILKEEPELVFLDVMMPKMNGFEVCRQVRLHTGTNNNIYIVLLTAKGQESDRKKGEEVGADLYMTKPFDPEEVVKKTMEILG